VADPSGGQGAAENSGDARSLRGRGLDKAAKPWWVV